MTEVIDGGGGPDQVVNAAGPENGKDFVVDIEIQFHAGGFAEQDLLPVLAGGGVIDHFVQEAAVVRFGQEAGGPVAEQSPVQGPGLGFSETSAQVHDIGGVPDPDGQTAQGIGAPLDLLLGIQGFGQAGALYRVQLENLRQVLQGQGAAGQGAGFQEPALGRRCGPVEAGGQVPGTV
ncbi:hypothetical protein DSECCO2_484850 [anaerobic digester metagenome]